MRHYPKVASTRTIYQNKYIKVKVDGFESQGQKWEQVYFEKPNKNASGVIPIDDKGIYLVNQYRHPSKKYFWQLPMGMIDPGKTDLQTAIQELQEEAGLSAGKLTKLGSLVAEPGLSSQKTFIYVGENLKKVHSHPQITEVGMSAKRFTYAKINQMVQKGEIECGFTLSAILLFKTSFRNF